MPDTLLAPLDYWRAIVLYGANVATYKIALAACLIKFAEHGKTHVSMTELAQDFFHRYRDRLASGKPQLSNPDRKTVLERVVAAYTAGTLTETAAIDRVERQGFSDVVPRFHVVNGAPIPLAFYEKTATGLVLTDHLLRVFADTTDPLLRQEVTSRWDLLEAAFEMRLPVEVLGTDEHMIYRSVGYDRVDITGTHPVLNGYQNGLCFYCGEPLGDDPIHVDHIIPRAFLRHDEIWNLVRAHSVCNLAKSDLLPPRAHLDRLYTRNEYYIASNHPIKRHLIMQLGQTPRQRRAFLDATYEAARKVLIHVWTGPTAPSLLPNPLAAMRLTAETQAGILHE